MAEIIRLVQGDTKPSLIISLTDEETGEPISVNGAQVNLKIRPAGDENTLLQKTCNLLPGVVTPSGEINTAAPYDTLGSGGRIQVAWERGDLEIEEGAYEAEIEITFSDNTVQTVYDILKLSVREDF